MGGSGGFEPHESSILHLAIHYEPALPPQWSGLLQRSPITWMVKVLALYPRPFWRERGLNGLGLGNLPTLELTVDSSPPGGPSVLAGFIAGERRVWACTESASRWPGNFEGAIEAGLAAADQVRQLLA